MTHNTAIKGLGEIALQVHDLDSMQHFYAEIVGLELLNRMPSIAFFRIAAGVGGHTQVLALFDRGNESGSRQAVPVRRRPPLDHIAFGIELDDYAGELARLQALPLAVTTAVHEWIGWRSIYVEDPEGNIVEWVCFDPAIAPDSDSI